MCGSMHDTAHDIAEPSRRDVPHAKMWFALIVLLALSLRLYGLGNGAFWHDEAHNLAKTLHIWEAIGGEFMSNHPPLFPVLATIWAKLGMDQSEFTMRLLSTLLGVATVAMLYLATRKMFGTRIGLAAAFLLAISPFHIAHSQDLKAYILEPLTSAALVYVFYRAVEENRRGLWIAYAVVAGISCYATFFSGPLLLGINLWFLLFAREKRDRVKPWILANIAGALIFAPFLLLFLGRVNAIMVGAESWWINQPTLITVAYYMKTIAFGYPAARPHFIVATLVFSLAATVGLAVTMRRGWRPTFLLLAWFAFPTALVFVVSQFMQSIFLYRALLLYALPVYVFAGAAVVAMPWRPGRMAGWLVFAAIAATSLSYWYRGELSPVDWPHRPGTHPPRNYDEAAQFAHDHWEDGDILIHAAASTWLPFQWYGFAEKPHFFAGTSQEFVEIIHGGNPRNTTKKEYDGYYPDHVQALTEGHRRVWFVFTDWERHFLTGNPMQLWQWFQAHYTERAHGYFKDMDVILFEQQENGAPLAAFRRDNDDGVGYDIQTETDGHTFRVIEPDSNLLPTPVEARRGSLLVSVAEPDSYTQPQDASLRRVAVRMENRGEEPVRARLEHLGSDGLMEAASLYSEDARSDQWEVAGYYNPQAPPPSYPLHTASAGPPFDTPVALAGPVALPPGRYRTLVHMLGMPRDTAHRRAHVNVRVAGNDLFGGVGEQASEAFDWGWYQGALIDVQDMDTEVRITPQASGDAEERWANIAYIAFQRQSDPQELPTVGARHDAFSQNIEIAPGEIQTIAVDIPAIRTRFDAWVFEYGEGGKSYWVYEVAP